VKLSLLPCMTFSDLCYSSTVISPVSSYCTTSGKNNFSETELMVSIFSSSVVEMYTRTNEIFCVITFFDRLYYWIGDAVSHRLQPPCLLCTSMTMNHECQCWQWPRLTPKSCTCYIMCVSARSQEVILSV
jgi:hypothetical protein